jgi:hypothetical protein
MIHFQFVTTNMFYWVLLQYTYIRIIVLYVFFVSVTR